MELTQVLNQVEVERKRGEALDEMRKASRKQCWWEAPIDELGSGEPEQLSKSLEELKKKVAEQVNKILVESTHTSPFFKVNAYENETKPNDQTSSASAIYDEKSKGRQKVEMVKMPNESNLQVTFSKRRSGLFKKASELCTLCGADVAIVVFSPGKKVFSFGHPCVESVVDRFLTRNPQPILGTMQLIEAHCNAGVQDLNMQLTQVLNQLEAEKKRGEELTKMRKSSIRQCWWQAPIEELNQPQLEHLKVSLEELKKNVAKQAEKLLIQSSAPPQYFPRSLTTRNGGIHLPFDPKNTGFSPNMMPPPPPPHQIYNPEFGHGFN
ncbi:hypothetical protein Dsin_024456 [Dipteronia sinensis]|uniref:MADS-box domain-containing protein n=1 Tax=Dipteronia sinensis TaxID=43782 RepID=A0AAD9ZUJ3_9ROSI|nr:hypothetical protein Dsin_024456 [Dipteronia sinensis]